MEFSIFDSIVTCINISLRRTHDYQGKTRKLENIGTVIMSTKFEQLKRNKNHAPRTTVDTAKHKAI